jgi:hypothetical protein
VIGNADVRKKHRVDSVRGWECSAYDFYFDAEGERFPGAVGGVDGGAALDGERQAGAIAKREAERAGLRNQLGSEAGLFLVEVTYLKSDTPNSAPGKSGWDAAEQESRVHLGEIHCAE